MVLSGRWGRHWLISLQLNRPNFSVSPLGFPLFSIITVSLNDCDGLQRTHRSITGQTCRDFDWIVVDGGSRDGTLEYLLTPSA